MRKGFKWFALTLTIIAGAMMTGMFGGRGLLLLLFALVSFAIYTALDHEEYTNEVVCEAVEDAVEKTARETMRMLGYENADDVEIHVRTRITKGDE